tara:strand:+ start:61 stop:408 length:348 start_codon:yes stop_codon:yes gene_type:complete
MNYKKDEIQEYFNKGISIRDSQWLKDNRFKLHHHAFGTETPYIIGTYQAEKWLGDKFFQVIRFIKDCDKYQLGYPLIKKDADLLDPVKVVNMYVFYIGSEIVAEYLSANESLECI